MKLDDERKHQQLDDFFGTPKTQSANSNGGTLGDTLIHDVTPLKKLRLLPKILSRRERYVVIALLTVMAVALLAVPVTSYYHFTLSQPAYGGTFSEAVLGEPRLVNPLLAFNNDADRDLTALIYSGLLRYDEKGKLVPDLAKSYEVSGDGLAYTVYLKENAKWHDNVPVTADDVLFTIATAQNPEYASPQRVSWQGVEISRVNDHAVMFKLKNKYAQFLNALTIGIIPKHLWQDVTPSSFTLSELNIKPIGSGPYRFDKFIKDRLGRIVSYELKAYQGYYDGPPYIERIVFRFYDSETAMIAAYNANEVQGLSFVSAQNLDAVRFQSRIALKSIALPRYFALFFNQNQSKIVSDKNVRVAMSYATDKQMLVDTILNGKGVAAHSPMVAGGLDITTPTTLYVYDKEQAQQTLATAGWANPDKDGILTKGKDRLALTLTTSTWPELVQVAQLLKDTYRTVGIDITVRSLPIAQLQQAIKERDYQMLLFGEIISIDPDPFSLWHSSQKREPGLNLALYDNPTADALLEAARQTLNPLERAKKYEDFQNTVIQDAPAVFLYSPSYLYPQPRHIKGMDTTIIATPANRFDTVTKWYIETQRDLR
ncbi:MAG: ABC transporter substrate-binding protein [Patescibacteria group bacterium]